MIDPAFVVKRKLYILPSTPVNNVDAVLARLISMPGVEHVYFMEKKHRIDIQYDGATINIADILPILAQKDVAIKNSWWQRRRVGYYLFVDKNVRDNAHFQPVCCNKPPSVRRKR